MDSAQSWTSVSLLGKLHRNPKDEDAWRDFVKRYGRKILQWCRQWRLQDADAEDVTQIVLAKHRNGPTGTIHLRFREKIARFEDLLVRQPEDWEEEV